MPPGLPRYVVRIIAKGRPYYYFRYQGKLLGGKFDTAPGTPDFHRDYATRLERYVKGEKPAAPFFSPGTIGALVAAYQASPEFRSLAPKTQRDYQRAIDRLAPIASFAVADVKRSHVVMARNKVASKSGNRSADLFVAVVSAMFRVGMDLDFGIEINPAHGIKRLADSERFKVWPSTARKVFEAADHPEWLRTGYMIGLWTTLRLGDVLKLSRANFDGVGFDVTHSKTSEQGYIPAAPALRRYLSTLPRDRLLWVVDEAGRAVASRRFSKAMREALDSLGYPELSFHGLRGTTATALAEAGASDQEIAAITGHRSVAMVRRYTESARQKVLAGRAIGKLGDGDGNGNGT